MRKLRELNTACKIIKKDGSESTFSSIEEASEKTGISIATIKIRCNKPNVKSFPKFEWLDEKTKLHYRAKKSKTKGKNTEYWVVDKLKSIGYSSVCRAAGESKALDNNKVDIADPSGELEVAIQVKNTLNTPNYSKIKSETTDPREFVLIWKRADNGETTATIDADFFFKLLKLYHSLSNE